MCFVCLKAPEKGGSVPMGCCPECLFFSFIFNVIVSLMIASQPLAASITGELLSPAEKVQYVPA